MCRELHLWRAGGLTANKPPRSSVETPMTSISHDTSTASDRASSVRCSERAFGPTGRPTLACACSGVGRAGLPTPDGRGRSSASSSTAPPSHSTELMVMAFALELSILRRRHSSSTRSSRVFAPTQGRTRISGVESSIRARARPRRREQTKEIRHGATRRMCVWFYLRPCTFTMREGSPRAARRAPRAARLVVHGRVHLSRLVGERDRHVVADALLGADRLEQHARVRHAQRRRRRHGRLAPHVAQAHTVGHVHALLPRAHEPLELDPGRGAPEKAAARVTARKLRGVRRPCGVDTGRQAAEAAVAHSAPAGPGSRRDAADACAEGGRSASSGEPRPCDGDGGRGRACCEKLCCCDGSCDGCGGCCDGCRAGCGGGHCDKRCDRCTGGCCECCSGCCECCSSCCDGCCGSGCQQLSWCDGCEWSNCGARGCGACDARDGCDCGCDCEALGADGSLRGSANASSSSSDISRADASIGARARVSGQAAVRCGARLSRVDSAQHDAPFCAKPSFLLGSWRPALNGWSTPPQRTHALCTCARAQPR